MVWGPQIIQGIAKIRGEVAWALARVLLILSHRGQTLTHCPASKEKGFYSTGLTLAELPSSGAGGLSYYLKFFTPMFKSVVSGRGVLCNSEGDTPSPQMLYGSFHIVPHIALPPSMGILSGACSALGKHLGGGFVSWGGLGE